MPRRILTPTQMTEHALAQAWRRTVAGSDLLDDAMLPPIGTSPDQYARRAGHRGGLGLLVVLDEDGTVHGCNGPYQEVFATRDVDQVLYHVAEQAVRHRAEHIVAHSPGQGPVANLVAGQAKMLEESNPAWASRFRSGGGRNAGGAPVRTRPAGRPRLDRPHLAGSGPVHQPRLLPR